MHVHAGDLQAVPRSQRRHFGKLGVPDAVFGVVAAGVGLVAMAVAEARVDSQRDRVAGRGSPSCAIMSGEPTLTCTPLLTASSSASSSKISAV